MNDRIRSVPYKWAREVNSPPAPGIIAGGFLYLSGQVAYDEDGEIVGIGDVIAQSEQCFNNIKDVIGRVGASMTDIIKLTTFFAVPLTMDVTLQYWDVRKKFFGDYKPASSGLQVSALIVPEILIEIEAIVRMPD